jgi:hypothetical protein
MLTRLSQSPPIRMSSQAHDRENRPICSRVSQHAQPRRGRQGEGNGQFIEGVRHGFIKRNRRAVLSTGSSGPVFSSTRRWLSRPSRAGMPARSRHRAIAERKELR